MNTTLVIVGCGFPQLGLLRAARALGLDSVGLDASPTAVGVPLASRFLQVSTGDPDAIAATVSSLGARAIATTGSELALATTATVAARLELPFYADPETVYRCQAKGPMRAAYRAAGLRTPRFEACTTLDEARKFVAKVGLPVVIKPAHGWGQRGVARVDRNDDLPRAVDAAAAVSHGGGGVVLEECLRGPEYSVNAWVEGGELTAYAVTDREVFAGVAPLGVMRSEVSPASLSPSARDAVIDAAGRAAHALGLVSGPCYSQVCMTTDGPVLFETAARCGGGFDADVTRLVSGVDLYRRILGVALGDSDLAREGPREAPYPAALVRFLAPPRGRVVAVRGVDDARAIPGVLDAAMYARPGDVLAGLMHAASRVGHLLCAGATREAAVEAADRGSEVMAIDVE